MKNSLGLIKATRTAALDAKRAQAAADMEAGVRSNTAEAPAGAVAKPSVKVLTFAVSENGNDPTDDAVAKAQALLQEGSEQMPEPEQNGARQPFRSGARH